MATHSSILTWRIPWIEKPTAHGVAKSQTGLSNFTFTFHLPALEKEMATHSSIILYAAAAKSLQSCPTLCDPIDGSTPGSPIPRILQARTLAVPSTWSLFRRYSPVSSFSVQACAQWGRGGPSLAPLAKKSNPPSILFLLFLTFLRL